MESDTETIVKDCVLWMKAKCGANLNSKWVSACLNWFGQKNDVVEPRAFKQEAFKQFLNSNLSETSLPVLGVEDLMDESKSTLEMNRNAFELVECLDVGKSFYSQYVEENERDGAGNRLETIFEDLESSMNTQTQQQQKSAAKRTFLMTLSDGYCQFKALEYRALTVSLPFARYPKGLKVLLRGSIPLRLGCLLLSEDNLSVIGCIETDRFDSLKLVLLEKLKKVSSAKSRVDKLILNEEKLKSPVEDDDDELLAMIADQNEKELAAEANDVKYLALEGRLMADGERRWIIRGFIATIKKQLSVCGQTNQWTMECVVNDGSKSQEVRVSNKVLDKLLGVSAPDFKQKLAQNRLDRSSDSALKNEWQQKLANFCGGMLVVERSGVWLWEDVV